MSPNANELFLQQIEANMKLLKNFKLPESLKKPNSTCNDRARITEDINNLQEINNIAIYLEITPIDLKPYIECANDWNNYPFSKLVFLLVKLREELELLKGKCNKEINNKLEEALKY
jgi:hypothetical protein